MPPKPLATPGQKPSTTIPTKPAVKPTQTSTTVKPTQSTTTKPVVTNTTVKTAQTVATNKPAPIKSTTTTSSSLQKPLNPPSKPADSTAKPKQNINKPSVISTKPTATLVKPGLNSNIASKPGVASKTNNIPNQKLDPAAAKKKEEEEKKLKEQEEEKLKEQKRLEEIAQQEELEKKIKQEEEDKKLEEEKKKKQQEEEEEKAKQEAILAAEKQYKEAKLQEEKRIKEEQEKLKNGKIFIKTNTGGMTSTVEFKIADGQVNYALVDDELALEFAYEKGYQFILTAEKDKQPDESISFFSQGSGKSKTFNNLQAGTTYWCVVFKNDAAEAKRKAYKFDDSAFGSGNNKNGARQEGCSCLYGNPCVDQYVCQDWNNRFTVAKNNLTRK